VDHFLAQYSNCDPFTDCTWALKDFGKFNVSSAQPVSATVGTRLEQFWYRSPVDRTDERSNSAHRGGGWSGSSSDNITGGTGLSFLLQLSLPADAHTLAGAPATIWLQVTVSNQARGQRRGTQ
jgi:hypothetical protein